MSETGKREAGLEIIGVVEHPRIFVTQSGAEIPLRAVSPHKIKMVADRHTLPEPPTYKVELPGHSEENPQYEEIQFDQDTIDGLMQEPPTYTDAEGNEHPMTATEPAEKQEWQQEQWDTYLRDQQDIKQWEAFLLAWRQASIERTRRTNYAELYFGTVVPLPEDTGWIEDQKWGGIVVPVDDERELTVHYILTELLTGVDDLKKILDRIRALSTLSVEEIRAAEEAFCRQHRVQGETPERVQT